MIGSAGLIMRLLVIPNSRWMCRATRRGMRSGPARHTILKVGLTPYGLARARMRRLPPAGSRSNPLRAHRRDILIPGRPAVPAVSMGMGRPAYYPPVTVPDSNPAVLTPYVPSGTAHEIHDPSNPYSPYTTQPSGLTQAPHPTQSRHTAHTTGSPDTPYASSTPQAPMLQSSTGPPIATRTQNDTPPIYTHNPTTGSPITRPLSSLQPAGRASALVPTPRPQIPTLAEIRTLSRAPSVHSPPDRFNSPAPTIGWFHTTGTAPPPYNEFRV